MERSVTLLTAAVNGDSLKMMESALLILGLISAAMVLCSVVFLFLHFRSRSKKNVLSVAVLALLIIAAVASVTCTVISLNHYNTAKDILLKADPQETAPSTVETTTAPETEAPTTEPTEPPTEPEPTYVPEFVELSNPENWGIRWEIIQDDEIVESYRRSEPISFSHGDAYTALQGVVTFRGDNYRSGPSFGTANVVEETLTKKWSSNIGSYNGWPGSGWTGQPLIVRWDEETKAIMNLYPEKKSKEDLVEVILATLDGYIYFYDLDDGSYTRDPLWVGMNFKGAGALDPRGYPLMYVGSGDYDNGKAPRMYIISLIDGSILYERSGTDSFSLRSGWSAFDSSPLVHAETDTLIWPGESGILYTIKLNSSYDKAQGTITVAPEETVRTRYSTARSNGGTYWLGYEPSAVIVDHYLYISENGGMFFCIDLNSMELIWCQDTRDDSNSTPVFQWDESGQTGYIYTAPSLHWTASGSMTGHISIYKLDARTGEIIWEKAYDCHTVSGVSGGVQASPLLGKPGTDLEGLIIYPIARTPNGYDGTLVALDCDTGEVVWDKHMPSYSWSSPAPFYTESGKAYVAICDSAGELRLLDGKTGNELSSVSLGSNVEASPAVFENTLVVGTRGQKVYGICIN